MPLADRLVHKGDEAGEGGVGAADDGTRRHLEHGAQRLELRGEAGPAMLWEGDSAYEPLEFGWGVSSRGGSRRESVGVMEELNNNSVCL